MARQLFELVGTDDRRFSPYCWRIRLALAHKRLEAARVPVRFTDKELIAFSGGTTVPVLVDGPNRVRESWAIACYLEDTYPTAHSLFGGPEGRALARFFNLWTDTQLQPSVFQSIIGDLFQVVLPEDKAYFRKTREARLGRTLEEAHALRPEKLAAFKAALTPLRLLLAEQPFVCGAKPAYADYIVFGTFQWARMVSACPLLQGEDAVLAWRERMLDLYGGMGRGVQAFDDAA
ncbi:MAG TPA: glutathione S-transferase family protein [Alphaproteobacteria bacterium]|nr:glutathione S-transferase family protein [Alphaproteobacteria bacterium]